MPGVELTGEEDFAWALKALKDTVLQEQAAQATSILSDDVPGNFTNP